MTYKVIRTAILGIFLGISGALIIAMGTFMMKVYEVGKPAIESAQVLSPFAEAGGDTASSIIRFHVKANSDSTEDLSLKYEVRDVALKLLTNELSSCKSLEECEEVIKNNLDVIEDAAKNMVRERGYSYDVKAYITVDEFPMRQYGELVLPAGKYKALRIDIGEAKGENFWCLLYPTVCYTSDSGAVVSKEGGRQIKNTLSEDEYERLFIKRSVPKSKIKIRFKLFELIEELF